MKNVGFSEKIFWKSLFFIIEYKKSKNSNFYFKAHFLFYFVDFYSIILYRDKNII